MCIFKLPLVDILGLEVEIFKPSLKSPFVLKLSIKLSRVDVGIHIASLYKNKRKKWHVLIIHSYNTFPWLDLKLFLFECGLEKGKVKFDNK